MNILLLDVDPAKAARYHNDRHCAKMILTSAQLLSTAHWFLDGERIARKRVPLVLRPSHIHHPCARFVRKNHITYGFVHTLMGELLKEYALRVGHPHMYEERKFWHQLFAPPWNLPADPSSVGSELASWPQCMPDEFKRQGNPVEAYRAYYIGAKQHLATWSPPAKTPEWYIIQPKEFQPCSKAS
jgi:hypothetical protein